MVVKTEILISGGGIAGLSLALLLARLQVSVIVVDPAKPPAMARKSPSGRTAAVMQDGIDVLILAGLTRTQIDMMGAAMTAMRLIEPEDNGVNSDVTFRAQDIGLTAFGVNLPTNALHAALWALCAQSPFITLHTETTLAGLDVAPHVALATLSDGRVVNAQLLVGADGRHSAVRKLAGIRAHEKQYAQAAMTCLLSHTHPHHHTSTEIHYRGGPFTTVPFQGQTSALVYVDHADTLKGIASADLAAHIQAKSKGLLGDITPVTTPDIWPLMSLRAAQITAPRVALVAEAAHVVSPIGAQGLNLSLRDVKALSETVSRAVTIGLTPGDANVLEEYERQRHNDIIVRTVGVDLFHSSVASQSSFHHALRMTGANLISGFPALKRKFAKLGLG
ncbi:MAG: FAD-dependent monooxygenase [Pseudomonadota bacterium]